MATQANDLFITGLVNAHAMERQALSIMRPQVERLEEYPEMVALLRRHIIETETQAERLETVLTELGESPSGLKDTMLSMGGAMAAMGHTMADDEVIKNALANYAFEHFEIAAYTSLLVMARSASARHMDVLEQNLSEERWIAEAMELGLPAITLRYVQLHTETARGL